MTRIIQIKRGPSVNLTALTINHGELVYTTDTQKLYIGSEAGEKILINPDVASSAETATLLQNARNFSITGDVTAEAVSFDGSANVVLNAVLRALQSTDIPELPQSKITNLETNLSDINIVLGGLGTASTKNVGISAGNVPVLDASGKLDNDIIPSIAITDTFVVPTIDDLYTLTTAGIGDVGIVTGISKSYILSTNDYSNPTNWKELLIPPAQTPTDIGAEPAITAGSANQYYRGDKTWASLATDVEALAIITNKANLDSPTFTGTPIAPTPEITTNNTQVATTAFVHSVITDATGIIDGGIF